MWGSNYETVNGTVSILGRNVAKVAVLDILPLEASISRYPEETIIKVESTEVEFSPDTLPRALRVYVFEPAG